MKIENIIILILVIISAVFVFWYAFGNSPTFEQAILVLILTVLFTNNSRNTKRDVSCKFLEERFNRLEKSFIKLVDDVKEYKV
ncbi:hypothetical protein CL618_03400 [archaeon]|nr:hypothetical protein [archaeon]|tara:strand:- start:4605 stop:4853 length:249 start_codon:yes stop_codon:yes gene_type:complete